MSKINMGDIGVYKKKIKKWIKSNSNILQTGQLKKRQIDLKKDPTY